MLYESFMKKMKTAIISMQKLHFKCINSVCNIFLKELNTT